MGYNLLNNQPVLCWHQSMVWSMLLQGDLDTQLEWWHHHMLPTTKINTCHNNTCCCLPLQFEFFTCASHLGMVQNNNNNQHWFHKDGIHFVFASTLVGWLSFWSKTCQKDICCCAATATQNISLCDEGCHIVVIILEAAQNNNNNQQGN